MNIYTVAYKFDLSETNYGIDIFTNKKKAINMAKYYRETLHCAFVALRHDKSTSTGECIIQGLFVF